MDDMVEVDFIEEPDMEGAFSDIELVLRRCGIFSRFRTDCNLWKRNCLDKVDGESEEEDEKRGREGGDCLLECERYAFV